MVLGGVTCAVMRTMPLYARFGATATKLAEAERQWGAVTPNSLLARKYSVFECVGNSCPTLWIHSKFRAEAVSVKPEFGEVPCIFPGYEGITVRDEFALDSPLRH